MACHFKKKANDLFLTITRCLNLEFVMLEDLKHQMQDAILGCFLLILGGNSVQLI